MENKIPEYILKNLRQRCGLDENDSSHDKTFEQLSLATIVEEYFAWEGIIGYGNKIVDVVTDLQKIGVN